MVGTIDEILLYIMLDFHNAEQLEMSRQRMVCLRNRLKDGVLGEETKKKLFLRWQNSVSHYRRARCIRDAMTIPAVVRDKHGKFFTEQTFLLMVEHEEKMDGLHLNRVCEHIRFGQFPNPDVVREALRRKGWTMFQERTYLPAIWELE